MPSLAFFYLEIEWKDPLLKPKSVANFPKEYKEENKIVPNAM